MSRQEEALPRRPARIHLPPVLPAFGRRRVVALLLLVAVLFGLVTDAALRVDALRPHVVCPEDGELLHADGASGPRLLAPASRAHQIQAVAPHDHGFGCLLATLAVPPPPVLLSPGWVLFAPWRLHLNPVPAPVLLVPVRSVLADAPKTSPPSQA